MRYLNLLLGKKWTYKHMNNKGELMGTAFVDKNGDQIAYPVRCANCGTRCSYIDFFDEFRCLSCLKKYYPGGKVVKIRMGNK